MAVYFVYTNRCRRIHGAKQNIHFHVRLPMLGDVDGRPCHVNNYDSTMSFKNLKTEMQILCVLDDYVIFDWDTHQARYYRKRNIALKKIDREELPISILDYMSGMAEVGEYHVAEGEFIPAGAIAHQFGGVVGDSRADDFSTDIDQQHEDCNSVIEVRGVRVFGTPDIGDLHFKDDSSDDWKYALSPVVLDDALWPSVLGVNAYEQLEPGETIETNTCQILIENQDGDRRWMAATDHDVCDRVVRRINGELRVRWSNETILYGDFIRDANGNLVPATAPTCDDIKGGIELPIFRSLSCVGSQVGDFIVFTPIHRVVDESVATRIPFSGWRYLNRDDHVQEGDVLLSRIDCGMGCYASPVDGVGRKLSNDSSTIIRPIGAPGWKVIVRSSISHDMQVEYQVREMGKVVVDWREYNHIVDELTVREYERSFFTVYFRRWMPGYRDELIGDPNFELPFGLEWVGVDDRFENGDVELKRDGQLKPIDASWIGHSCKRSFIYARSVISDWHRVLDWPSVIDQTSLKVEYVGNFQGANPFYQVPTPAGYVMVLTRHGLSLVLRTSIVRNGINTPIGDFYASVFTVNHKKQIVYCSDQIPESDLADRLKAGLVNLMAATERYLPFITHMPAIEVKENRRAVRSIEL